MASQVRIAGTLLQPVGPAWNVVTLARVVQPVQVTFAEGATPAVMAPAASALSGGTHPF